MDKATENQANASSQNAAPAVADNPPSAESEQPSATSGAGGAGGSGASASADSTAASGSACPTSSSAAAPGSAPASHHADPASRKRVRRRILRIVVIVVVALVVIGAIVMTVAKSFTEQEKAVRSDWSIEAGQLLTSNDDLGIDVHDAGIDSELRVLRLVPTAAEDDGFTYYDTDVQNRIAQAITDIQQLDIQWTASNPLAILNPFGTGSNGLYLYFTTDRYTSVTYTIESEGADPFTASARDIAVETPLDANEDGLARTHSFQIVGLVPGAVNNVALTITGPAGNVTQTVTFSVNMPETDSGYPTHLDSAAGSSAQPLSDGLYALMRTNGYLGYGFFFDNGGTMRYEMVTEGFGLDRMLFYDNDLVTCTSTQTISRIDGLGRVKAVYRLDGYDLHHDINYGSDNTVVALAERSGSETVEDIVLEINLDTGAVEELVDFSDLMADYRDDFTHVITPANAFFWQAGEWDWIHLNTIEYFAEDDSIVVSSRETSTIMKVADVHGAPQVSYFVGDEAQWEGTPYEQRSFEQVGDFTPQYGQHSVEYDGEGPSDGSYYLLMFNNNYWANSTRDDFAPNLDGTDVGTDLYNGTTSYVYRYLVDEQAGTFELTESFAVPYSSIVSNVSHAPASDNYVVNSGVANVFGEYDHDGQLIRQFSYTCQLQGYRVFKDDFAGFWFAL